MNVFFAGVTFGAALLGCAQVDALDPPLEDVSSESQGLSGQGHQLIQAGAHLLLLGVTSDDHALYQDGETVYATALRAGATRQLVGQVPAGNTAFVYTVGEVAFCWTNPDRSIPGFGVSPLVVWSAASGAHEASAASPIGTFATSASADGRTVLFPTNGNADGSVGDIEIAATDLSQRATLLGDVPMGFPFGPCRPFAAFVGRRDRSHPVALHCEGGASSATLSSWEDGERLDLLGGVATPPFFTTDVSGNSFFTTLAGSGHPVVVSASGEETVLDEVPSRLGFFARGGAVVYTARTAAGVELRRASPDDCPEVETLAGGVAGVLTVLAGSKVITDAWTSPDGLQVPFFSQRDPATGLTDVQLVDALRGGVPRSADSQARNALSGPPFSADSKHSLFTRFDVSTGASHHFAFGEGGARQISDANGWSYQPGHGALVSFNDNVQVAPSFADWTSDLKVIDLGDQASSARLIAPGAHLTYFSSHRGRRLAFTTDHPDVAPGLYSARAHE